LRHNSNDLLGTKVSNNFKIVEEGYFVNFVDVKSGLEKFSDCTVIIHTEYRGTHKLILV